MSDIKRMHQCGDGTWRHARHYASGAQVRLTRLDADGKPTGETTDIGTAVCVHFSFEDEVG